MHPVRRFTDSSHMKFRPKVNHPLRLVKKTAPEQLTGIVGKAMAFVRAITAPASSTNPNVNVNGSSFSA